MATFSAKQKSLALIPKFTGGLSLIGSAFIFQDIMKDRKKRSKSTYHRIILGLSFFDIIASVVNVLSTWPIPAGTPGVYLASGTTGTCTAQGFFNEVGNVCTPLYNASLCMFYILMIKKGRGESRIQKIEKRFHAVPVFFGLAMGFLGIGFKLYNSSGWLCWFAPLPPNCNVAAGVPCVRGQYASIFRWVHYAIIWSAILFVTFGMFTIYKTVSDQEKKTKHLTNHKRASVDHTVQTSVPSSGEQQQIRREKKQSKSRKIANQAMLFVGALYVTWLFTTLTRIFQIVHGKTYYPLLVLMAIFFPLQGFFNAMVYIRPRYLRARAKYPELSFFRLVFQVVSRSIVFRRSSTITRFVRTSIGRVSTRSSGAGISRNSDLANFSEKDVSTYNGDKKPSTAGEAEDSKHVNFDVAQYELANEEKTPEGYEHGTEESKEEIGIEMANKEKKLLEIVHGTEKTKEENGDESEDDDDVS